MMIPTIPRPLASRSKLVARLEPMLLQAENVWRTIGRVIVNPLQQNLRRCPGVGVVRPHRELPSKRIRRCLLYTSDAADDTPC
eukprot:5080419-Pyramimonas_sp.AAC.1